MFRTTSPLVLLLGVLVLASPLASAATYTNAAVTNTTLAENGSVNVLDGYTVSWTGDSNYIKVGNAWAAQLLGVTLNIVNGSTVTADNYMIGVSSSSSWADYCVGLIDSSTVTITGNFTVGATLGGAGAGTQCSATIQNGGRLFTSGSTSNGYNYIGSYAADTTGTMFTVTGSGSLYSTQDKIRMFDSTMDVLDGAMVVASNGTNYSNGIYGDSTGGQAYVRLGSGYIVTGATGIGTVSSPINLQLWTGSAWVNVETLTEQEKADLGYSVTQLTSEAQFNQLTGGAYTDVAASFLYPADSAQQGWLYSVVPVPEPATMALLGAGAMALLRRRRK